VRKTATLGGTYPEIVAVLEKAMRQKNLSGEMVVDAVPVSNRVYLEAVLGRDTTAKHDDSVTRASREVPKPGWRRLFGIFGRNANDEDETDFTTSPSKNASSQPTRGATAGANPSDPPNRTTSADRKDGESAKQSDDSKAAPTAKRDDAVQKATGEDTPAPRRRLFDLFRRDDQ
jgi:hypothetical protein